MNNPAFIVEGKHEKKIVERLCGTKYPIRMLGNGEDVSTRMLAEKIDLILDSFSNRHFPIVIVFDRERREMSARKLREEVEKHLTELRRDAQKIIFGIPDRKIEAWIIPFVEKMENFSKEPTNDFEGKDCLGELEKRLRNKNVIYDKATVGTKLFCDIDPIRLAKVSKSFELFLNEAGNLCPWFNSNVQNAYFHI